MRKLELETEVIQISIYSDIIVCLLKNHRRLSLNKMLFFSYVIKKSQYNLDNVYTAKNTQDVVYKVISLISGDFKDYCLNVKFIIKAIHLLITKNIIVYNGTMLSMDDNEKVKTIYKESPFVEKAIEESKIMSDKQFMTEVISNV